MNIFSKVSGGQDTQIVAALFVMLLLFIFGVQSFITKEFWIQRCKSLLDLDLGIKEDGREVYKRKKAGFGALKLPQSPSNTSKQTNKQTNKENENKFLANSRINNSAQKRCVTRDDSKQQSNMFDDEVFAIAWHYVPTHTMALDDLSRWTNMLNL